MRAACHVLLAGSDLCTRGGIFQLPLRIIEEDLTEDGGQPSAPHQGVDLCMSQGIFQFPRPLRAFITASPPLKPPARSSWG